MICEKNLNNMLDGFIFADLPINLDNQLPSLLTKSQINLVNLHSGVWALFHVHSTDESISSTQQDIFKQAKKCLENISHEELYDIMSKDLPNYKIDLENMFEYATKIIKITGDRN